MKKTCRATKSRKPESLVVIKYSEIIAYVAAIMKKVAAKVHPKYILNVGDNFYPGGIEAYCSHGGSDACSYLSTGQWDEMWEKIYDGPDLGKLEWWSVMGNHDWGGSDTFSRAWDQQIAFTWHHDRWLMPALYWERKVLYCDLAKPAFVRIPNRSNQTESYRQHQIESNRPNGTDRTNRTRPNRTEPNQTDRLSDRLEPTDKTDKTEPTEPNRTDRTDRTGPKRTDSTEPNRIDRTEPTDRTGPSRTDRTDRID